MNKYELIADMTKVVNNETLYRIRALRDFGSVKAGDIGGWVKSERNLSQDGDCWVGGEAQVRERAKVFDNAQVIDNADISGKVWVYGEALVSGEAKVVGDTWIHGKSKVDGSHTWLSVSE